MSHRPLAPMAPADIVRELRDSRNLLEKLTGHAVIVKSERAPNKPAYSIGYTMEPARNESDDDPLLFCRIDNNGNRDHSHLDGAPVLSRAKRVARLPHTPCVLRGHRFPLPFSFLSDTYRPKITLSPEPVETMPAKSRPDAPPVKH